MDGATLAEVDLSALADWLESAGVSFDAPLELTPIGEGKSNITLLLSDGRGRRWVARRGPRGTALASAHDVRREARVLAGVARAGDLAPRPVALCEEKAVCPVTLLVMEHRPGVALAGVADAERLAPAARAAIGPAMARKLAAIHAIDTGAAGLADLAADEHYGRRQLRRWRRQWEGSTRREVTAVLDLATELEARLPPRWETVLVHGDFHLLNCLVDPAEGEIEAVLDWELSTLGDPIADLGTLLAYWGDGDDHLLGAPFDLTGLPGFSSAAEVAAAYAAASGRDLDSLAFWRALALWKIAIIAEGVNQRHEADPTNPGGPGEQAVDRLLGAAANLLETSVRA